MPVHYGKASARKGVADLAKSRMKREKKGKKSRKRKPTSKEMARQMAMLSMISPGGMMSMSGPDA